MTNLQNAKLNMYQSVLDVCIANEDIYISIKAFEDGVKIFKTNISDIRETKEKQTNVPVAGATQSKQAAEDRLVELTVQVANGTYVYAFEKVNTELKKLSTVNRSELYRAEGNALLSKAKNIMKNAGENAEQLIYYGITDNVLAELETAIAEFELLLTKPRGTIVERKVYTGNLPRLFAAADSTLYDKLDKLIMLFKTSNPDFYSAYKAARNLIDTATRRRKDDSSEENKI